MSAMIEERRTKGSSWVLGVEKASWRQAGSERKLRFRWKMRRMNYLFAVSYLAHAPKGSREILTPKKENRIKVS